MTRPSRKAERKEEILAAYGRCIAAHGVDGATLDRIAEEAGLARALLRHNVGNKDELLEAFVDRFLERSAIEMEAFFNMLPDERRLEKMIEWLFDAKYADRYSIEVSNALVIAASRRPALAERLGRWIRDFVDYLRAELSLHHADAGEDRLKAVAWGVASIFFNVESMTPLGTIPDMEASCKAAALTLVSTLANPSRIADHPPV